MTTMDDVVVVESEDSENSIIEVEVPKKPAPPLIFIEDEEIVLNIRERDKNSILAKDFIKADQNLSVMSTSVESLSSPNHWTTDMIKFYDDDWGDEEDFVVEKLQEKMDKHPSLWNVSKKDKFKAQIQGSFWKTHMRCWNCGQRGHHVSDCPDPPHVVKCHMCGIEGHTGNACPNSKCLNCGNPSREFVTCCFKCKNQMYEKCSRCKLIGHNVLNCADHWRLFHITTSTTSVKIPDRIKHKPYMDLWCCNCGRKGHIQLWCRKSKNCGGFKDTTPFVISYERAFNFSQFNGTPNDIHLGKNTRKKKKQWTNKSEKILRLNPHNKVIWKDKRDFKNKLKRFKKNKKNKNKKKNKPNQRFFDGLLI